MYTGYDAKPSDGDTPGVLENEEYPFIAITPQSILILSGSIY